MCANTLPPSGVPVSEDLAWDRVRLNVVLDRFRRFRPEGVTTALAPHAPLALVYQNGRIILNPGGGQAGQASLGESQATRSVPPGALGCVCRCGDPKRETSPTGHYPPRRQEGMGLSPPNPHTATRKPHPI